MYQGSPLLKRADVGGAEQTIAAMLSETIERERTMTGEEREEEEKQSNGKMQREIL